MLREPKHYNAYKESGIPWLGTVPEHWDVLPNRALFAEVKERDQPEQPMLSVTIMKGVITQEALLEGSSKKDSSNQDKSAYKLVRPGDIAYNKMRAWQGAVGVSDHQGIVSPAYVVQRPREGVLSRYAHYLLRTPAFAREAERWSYGITSDMWSLRPEHFKMIYSCRPPLVEQAAIVRFLDHADRRIRRCILAKQKLIKLLGEQKQAIIHRAVTRGLDPNVPLKPTGVDWLGDVPELWDLLPLKYLSKRIQNGATPPSLDQAFYSEGTVPWFGPSSIGQSVYVSKPVRMLNTAAFVAGKARPIKAPALLIIVIGATAGKLALLGEPGATNQQITSYELRIDQVMPEFALYQLRGAEQWLRAGASTATIPILDSTVVSRLRVAVPPFREQRAILVSVEAETEGFEAVIARAEREIDLLREYRTSLIADVVTGKLDVREAAANLPDGVVEPDELLADETLEGGDEGNQASDELAEEEVVA